MIVQSYGALQKMAGGSTRSTYWPTPDSVALYGRSQAYATLYAKQPNIRTCVDFLARNIAQLAVHAFRRVSDTDRTRLIDHPIVRWLEHPNPATTRYRLIEALMGDLGIYFNAYWAKVRVDDGLGLVRLPPEQMAVEGALLPIEFLWTYEGRERSFAPSEVVFFNGYNPCNPLMGLSPLETLRQVLAEEAAAADHREKYWRNAARMEGVIERAKEAPNWTPDQQQQFREQWQEFAQGGARAGMIPILPKGMSLKTFSHTARESEYLSARKLSREECAAAYHIPLPMVGILDHATFSNIKEQHKQLYADCLGPWLEMIQLELEAQLLPESGDVADVYLEFNIADKLKGSFEEQATSLHTAIGRPFMTPNEGRARLNLPSIKDDPTADQIAAQQGATPAPDTPSADPNAPDAVPDDAALDDETNAAIAPVLQAARARQHARLQKVAPLDRSADFFAHMDRWNRELTADLAPIVGDARAARLALKANVETFIALEARDVQ